MKNKKASELLMDQIIFMVIIIAFGVIMMVFVTRYGSQAAIKEEVYAKQIALAIDKARTGTNIVIDVSSMYEDARKNKIQSNLITIDNNENKVIVHLNSGKGYSFGFFNNNPVSWNIEESVRGEEKLTLKIG